jgi:signal transduction histidine kinase
LIGILNLGLDNPGAFNEESLEIAGEVANSLAVFIQGTRLHQNSQQYTVELEQRESKLLDYQNQLRSLATELSRVEERERRHIASDLHDRIGQSLAMSKIRLGALRQMAAPTNLTQPIEELQTLIHQAIKDTRSLMFELSPPVLYELGFEASVASLTEQLHQQHDIPIHFEDDGRPKPLGADLRFLLFKAVHELLLNVIKHSQARNARVVIERDGAQLQTVVEDDGVGFHPAEVGLRVSQTGGFGLFSIRERLSYHGGELQIESSPGHGTQVLLKAPLLNNGKPEKETTLSLLSPFLDARPTDP